MISRASICSVRRMVPISEEICEPTLPAKIRQIIVGENSKMIITGDETQIDLPNKLVSGLNKSRIALSKIEKINVVEFENSDIIRNPLVAEILEALPKNK